MKYSEPAASRTEFQNYSIYYYCTGPRAQSTFSMSVRLSVTPAVSGVREYIPLMFELSKPHFNFWSQHSNASRKTEKKRKKKDIMAEIMINQELKTILEKRRRENVVRPE